MSLGPIAIDAALRRSPTGIGLYSDQLLRGLAQGPFAPRLLPLTPPPGRSRTLWMVGEVGPLLRRERAALFHGLANFDLPLQKPPGTRFVLTVHDLIPLEWPSAVSRTYGLQFRLWLQRSLALADAVICVSEAVAGALRARFPDAPKPLVIPHGADHVRASSTARIARAAKAGSATDWRYFLYLGSLEPRKNILTLARAFAAREAELAPLGVELWIAGHLAFGGEATQSALRDLVDQGVGIRVLGPQPAEALGALVQNALALCAPSRAEGFGLPPLEALALGTPVLASDIPAHREVLGDAALFAAADDEAAFGSGLVDLARDGALRASLQVAGRERAARFSWARAVAETEALYRTLVG